MMTALIPPICDADFGVTKLKENGFAGLSDLDLTKPVMRRGSQGYQESIYTPYAPCHAG